MPRKNRPSSPGPDSSPAQPATGPTPTPPPPTSPTISTVRRDPTTGNLLLATSDPRSTFRSTKLVVDTINLTNPRYGVGFVYASEWDRCEPVTDYTLLPRTLHHTRLFTPGGYNGRPHLQWTATSNPWFGPGGVALVRITSPIDRVDNATNCTLAEWLSVPEVTTPQPDSPAPAQIDDGGPAFPEHFYFDPGKGMCGQYVSASDVGFGGMTLRDYFAAVAMQGMIGCGGTYAKWATLARDAFDVADAMLAARKGGVS